MSFVNAPTFFKHFVYSVKFGVVGLIHESTVLTHSAITIFYFYKTQGTVNKPSLI